MLIDTSDKLSLAFANVRFGTTATEKCIIDIGFIQRDEYIFYILILSSVDLLVIYCGYLEFWAYYEGGYVPCTNLFSIMVSLNA